MGQEPNASEKLLKRNRELAILNSIAEALNRAVDVQEAIDASLIRVAELLGLRTGWVWLLDEHHDNTPYLAAAKDLPPFLREKPSRMTGTCLCLDTFLEGDLTGAANVNVLECSRLRGAVGGTEGLRYHSSIPIYAKDKPIGVLNVAGHDWRELEPEELHLLSTIGDMIGVAIERSRFSEESGRLATVEERNRLAREIHDTLAQGLAAITLHLETADALAEANPERSHEYVRRALELARLNLEEARRSVLDLRGALLEERDLPQALAELAKRVTREGLQVYYTPPTLQHPLPSRIEAAFYRIAQEALGNSLRHAKATGAWLELKVVAGEAMMVIYDNGQGFNPEKVSKKNEESRHFGLIGIGERAKLLGGRLKIASAPGEGTRIEISAPLVRVINQEEHA
jgi:two-component system NarL family sensor kinase